MSKHTPRPWEVAFGETVKIKDGNAGTVAIMTHLSGFSKRRPQEEVRANAHLMATAPDMYDALKVAESALSDVSAELFDVQEELDAVRAALARAEGVGDR